MQGLLRFGYLGSLLLLAGRAMAAELPAQTLEFESHPEAPAPVCRPSTAPSSQPPTTRGPHQVVPPLAALGNLAAPETNGPEAIAPALLAGFRLDSATGAAPPLRRIGLWGDSHAAAGSLVEALREALLARGIESDTTELPPTFGQTGTVLPLRHHCTEGRWTFEPAYRANGNRQPGALGLANLRGSRDGVLKIDFRDSAHRPRAARVVLRFLPSTSTARLALNLDGGPLQPVVLPPAAATQPTELVLHGTEGISTLVLRVIDGPLVLQGIGFEPVQPAAVTLDVFAFPSATVRGWALVDPDYLTASLAHHRYDGIVLQYGTNEGNDPDFDPHAYAQLLEAALQRMRAALPTASCLLIGPPDRGVRIPVAETTRAATPARQAALLRYAEIHRQIAGIQSDVGARYQCAAWHWQALMGGRGGAYRWIHHEPRWMAGDLTHLTAAGYRQTGDALAQLFGWRKAVPPATRTFAPHATQPPEETLPE